MINNKPLEQIITASKNIESIFIQLSESFPQLLNKENNSSLNKLKELFTNLKQISTLSTSDEVTFFANITNKYSNFSTNLNESISKLNQIDKEIKDIKTISEEMELIALNAMVISIKSGEKGRAFSCITENLKRLSNTMNTYAENLINSEQLLVDTINSLQQLFSSLTVTQNKISKTNTTVTNNITNLIMKASDPLDNISKKSEQIYQPISKAMEGIQLQDIIRQSLDQVILALREYTTDKTTTIDNIISEEEELDNICFSLSLNELECSVLEDTTQRIKDSSKTFTTNWSSVTTILSEIETDKNNYVHTILSTDSMNTNESILHQLSEIEKKYSEYILDFSSYQRSQKNLVRTCNSITSKVIAMNEVFANLSPVIGQLHHVRILQEIEVSKNLAISSVKNFVTDMDKLITMAKESVEKMQTNVEFFIKQINALVLNFSNSLITDNEVMDKLKKEKTKFFGEINSTKDSLSLAMQNFSVFPKDFSEKCNLVQDNFTNMINIENIFTEITNQLKQEQISDKEKKDFLLNKIGKPNWEIRNDKLKDLIKHFTITAHKEKAGNIAGFQVESGKEAGEITFF